MITMDAILLGGGVGRRFSEAHGDSTSPLPKQFQLLGNAPVFVHAARSFAKLNCFRQFLFVVPREHRALAEEQIRTYVPELPIRVVDGGEKRQDSSRLALEILERESPLPARVIIHDACRPYLSDSFLARIKASLLDRSYGAWVPVVPVIETLKRIENNQVLETVDRSQVHRVQTPQVFEYSVIRSLVEKTKNIAEPNFTDDASLCEYYGIPVGVFEGDVRNVKLTYEFELHALGSMLNSREDSAKCASVSDTTSTV